MRATGGWMVAGLAVTAAIAAGSVSLASDHLDGTRVSGDPPADIADVFAFTSPENPSRVVIAMTVTPYASRTATFSPLVDYAFRIQSVQALSPLTLDSTPRDVVCEFDTSTPQNVACTAPGPVTATAVVGDVGGGRSSGGSMRVFAGLRSDPAFFDRQGALATVASGRASFTGHNAFAGANVLALVVELDSATFAPPADGGLDAGPGGSPAADAGDAAVEGGASPILAVAAETVRRGM